MASVSSRRVAIRRRDSQVSKADLEADSQVKTSRWRRRTLFAFVGLGLLAWLAPIIAAATPLRDWPLGMVFHGMNGTIRSDSASFGWFSPVVYENVEVRDSAGNLLASAASISGEKTLLQWALSPNDLGTLKIAQPKLALETRSGGSNLEDVLAPWWSAGQSSPAKALTLQLSDGQITAHDLATGGKWQIGSLQSTLRWTTDSKVPAELEIAGTVQSGTDRSQFAIAYKPGHSSKLAADAQQFAAPQRIELQIEPLPLEIFQPVVARLAPGTQLAGRLSANLHYQTAAGKAAVAQPATADPGLVPIAMGQPPDEPTLDGQIQIDDFVLAGGPLGADRLQLNVVRVPCRVAWRGDQLDIEELAINCDTGQVGLSAHAALPTGVDSLWTNLSHSTFVLQGQVNLADLAKRLPHTLHLRPAMQVTSGDLRCSLTCNPAADGSHQWSGRLETSDLAATDNGRPIAWKKPIVATLDAHDGKAGLVVDHLDCQSSFLHVTGSGSRAQFAADATCDLNQLVKDLEQFITFDGLKLAGTGHAALRFEPVANGGFHGSADGEVRDFQFTLPDRRPWTESRLAVGLKVDGRWQSEAIDRIDSASLDVAAGPDGKPDEGHLTLKLVEPLTGLAASGPPAGWTIDATLQGDLARWQPRLAPWLTLTGWDLSGQTSGTARIVLSAGGFEVQKFDAQIDKLHAWNGAWYIDEPLAKSSGSVKCDTATGRISFGPTTLLTSSASVEATSATIDRPPQGATSLSGKVTYQADLARLSNWMHDPRVQPACVPNGRWIGQADLSCAAGVTTANFQSTVEPFAMYGAIPAPKAAATGGTAPLGIVPISPLSPGGRGAGGEGAVATGSARPVLWQEPKLSLNGKGSYDGTADALQLDSLEIGSTALHAAIAGKIQQLTKSQDAALTGTLDYDGQTLSRVMQPVWGNGLTFLGRQSRKFSLRGPLAAPLAATAPGAPVDPLAFLKPLVADGSFGWTSANLYGMTVGPGELNAELADGALQVKPMQLALSDGTLSAAPWFRLTPGPMELQIGPGPLVKQLRISPELCAQWLKFVAPMLSEATRTDGRLSIDLQGARVPLANPLAADIAGRLTIQSVGVTPGPIARPFALLTRQVEAIFTRRPQPQDIGKESPLLKIGPQQVDFRMVGGRMYHQNLELMVGNVTLRTHGSVGLADESLSLIAEMPVRREWVGTDPQMAQWRDQTVQFYIGGTLRHPQVDPRAMELLAAQMVKNTVQKITDPLKTEFQKVFHSSTPTPAP